MSEIRVNWFFPLVSTSEVWINLWLGEEIKPPIEERRMDSETTVLIQ